MEYEHTVCVCVCVNFTYCSFITSISMLVFLLNMSEAEYHFPEDIGVGYTSNSLYEKERKL
jgi:hypothetical protein